MIKRSSSNFLPHLIQPAVIIVLFTFLIFLFRMQYNASYFYLFSFPYKLLSPNITIFLLRSIDILIINIIILIVFSYLLSIIYVFKKDIIIKTDWLGNSYFKRDTLFSLLFVLYGCCFLVSMEKDLIFSIINYIDNRKLYTESNPPLFIFFMIIIQSMAYFFEYIYFKKIKFGSIFHGLSSDRSLQIFITLLTVIVFFNLELSSQMGTYDAIKLIEGSQGNYKIEINIDNYYKPINESNSSITDTFKKYNNTTILVAQQDGNYYFVEKKMPAPSNSPLYAVPINKVQSATITRIT